MSFIFQWVDVQVNGFEALLLRGQVASIESPKAAADDE